MRIAKLLASVAVLLLGAATLASAATAFTYQGRLSDGGAPANGSYDLEFRLFDALTAGNEIASAVTVSAVAVTNGLFTVSIDFGASFDGSPRWLQIAARTAGAGSFSTLTPRQQITPVPGALHATTADDALRLGGQPPSFFQPAITVLPVTSGGTGAADASTARANLGAASTGANSFSGTQQVSGNVSATGNVSGGAGSFSGLVSVGGLTIGGDASLPSAPRMYFPAFLSGQLTATVWTAAQVVPGQPIVVTRVIAQAKTPGQLCSVPAAIRLGGGTAGQDLFLGTGQSSADSGPVSLAFGAGTPLSVSLRSAAACSVGPADVFVTVEYRMGGAAAPACGPSYSDCNGFCTDVQTDSANCGTCGNPCGGGSGCNAGICQAPDGAACSAASECQSGNCVDGFCCNSVCNATCQACSAAKKGGGADGACGPIAASTDPDNECAAQPVSTCGTTGFCNGASACQLYEAGTVCSAASCSSSTVSANADACNGAGVCVDNGTTNCSPYACNAGTGVCRISCSLNSDCAPGNFCQGGVCTLLLANGSACVSPSSCQSNQCVDGFCCNSVCNAVCQACSAAKKGSGANGSCGPIAASTDPDDECATQPVSTCGTTGVCNGASACQLHAADSVCVAPFCSSSSVSSAADTCNGAGTCVDNGSSSCTPYACNGASGLCRTSCVIDADCTAPATCNAGICQ